MPGMWAIRVFLWTLVGALFIQGFLHAETYGSAPTMLGGMGLTMSIWKENLVGMIKDVASIPKAFVEAALKETARHPNTLQIPQIQRRMGVIQRTMTEFRGHEMTWYVAYADLIGGLQVEAEGIALWSHTIESARNVSDALKEAQQNQTRNCGLWTTSACIHARQSIQTLNVTSSAALIWRDILSFRHVSAEDWWWSSGGNTSFLQPFYRSLKTLHNVTGPSDPRLKAIQAQVPRLTEGLPPWKTALFRILLEGDIWHTCVEFVKSQDIRLHHILIMSGYQELQNRHARVLNASVYMLTDKEAKTVQAWFDEAASWSWWLSDDIVHIVKRCVGQTHGDCALIGPTEIAALMTRMAEGRRIAEDWSRRILIGLWNGMPAVFLVFILDMLVLLVGTCRKGDQSVTIMQEPLRDRLPETLRDKLEKPETLKDKPEVHIFRSRPALRDNTALEALQDYQDSPKSP